MQRMIGRLIGRARLMPPEFAFVIGIGLGLIVAAGGAFFLFLAFIERLGF